MTVIDLSAENVAQWFEMEGGGRVRLRSVTADEFRQIRRQTVKKKVEFKRVDGVPGRFEYEEVNDDLQNELFWDLTIVAWENLTDADGKEIPCTRENKAMLMRRSARFSTWVTDGLRRLAEAEGNQAEAASKN